MPQSMGYITRLILSDEQTKRDKSIKNSTVRFKPALYLESRGYIFIMILCLISKEDMDLLKTILRYLDTPQYLRKMLFPMMHQTPICGYTPPNKGAPHHTVVEDIKKVKIGDVRTGVIVKVKGQLFVEAGIGSLVSFAGGEL